MLKSSRVLNYVSIRHVVESHLNTLHIVGFLLLSAFAVTLFNEPAQAAQIQTLSFPSGLSQQSINFEVKEEVGSGESRVVFASLRSSVTIHTVRLFDPQQRMVWSKTPVQLGLTPRQIAQHPELGDAIALPELRLPHAGRWHFQLERAAPFNKSGLVMFSFRQLPRYELNLTTQEPSPQVGQIQNYVLRPTDFGASVLGLGTLPLDLSNSAGKTIQVPAAQEAMRTPNGILISNEPGAYISRFALPAAGVYHLRARQVFKAGRAVEALLTLQTNGGNATETTPVYLERISYESQGTCLQAAIFEIGVESSKSSFYAVTMLLVSGDNSRQLSRSAQLTAGSSNLQIRVPASTLHELGESIRVARLGLIRFEADKAIPIAEILDLKLSEEQKEDLKLPRCSGKREHEHLH